MVEKSEHIIRREHFVAGVETGIDSERDRIIALLEERGYPEHDDEVVICEPLDSLIALIRGETK